MTDLTAMLAGYRAKDWRRVLPPEILRRDRLLLIIDDYESVSETMTDFLPAHFVTEFARATFSTFMRSTSSSLTTT